MIRISKIYLVDGEEVNVSAEGGSAKEALAIIEQEAETLGPAPRAKAPGPAGTRARRTKAEMDAAKAAQESGAIPPRAEPAHPVGPEPTRVFGTPAQQIPVGPERAGPEPTRVFTNTGRNFAELPASGLGSTVSFAPGAPAPQDAKSVAFEGGPPPAVVEAPSPPPPPDSEEDTLREQINAVMKETIDLHPAWRDAVIAAMHRAAEKHGGDIFRMAAEPLRDVLKGVEEYQRKVREALAGGQRR